MRPKIRFRKPMLYPLNYEGITGFCAFHYGHRAFRAQLQHEKLRTITHYARPLTIIQARKQFTTNISYSGLAFTTMDLHGTVVAWGDCDLKDANANGPISRF